MNKNILITLAFLFINITYAQKKELKFTERNIKSAKQSLAVYKVSQRWN